MASTSTADAAADEQGVASVDASSPFDRLPDELVVAILQELHSDYVNNGASQYFGRGPFAFASPLTLLAFNKRFYRLARRIWTTTFDAVTFDYTSADDFAFDMDPDDEHYELERDAALEAFDSGILAKLLLHHDLHPRIESLEHRAKLDTTLYQGAILSHLVNLTRLDLQLTADPQTTFGDSVLRTPMTDALKHLKHLRFFQLSCHSRLVVEDSTFTFARHIPSLRTVNFQCRTGAGVTALLSGDAPLTSLKFRPTRSVGAPPPDYTSVPWHSLRRLILRADRASGIEGAAELLEALPLEHLRLEGTITGRIHSFVRRLMPHPRPPLPPITHITPQDLKELLHLLFEFTELSSLSIVFVVRKKWETLAPTRFEGLKQLELYGRGGARSKGDLFASLSDEENRAVLIDMLAAFPSLASLTLHDFGFDNPHTAFPVPPATYLASPTKYPALFDFLEHLREKTVVLRFVWTTHFTGEERKVVWRRETADDPFVEESYTAGRLIARLEREQAVERDTDDEIFI
ncbi:hypothetical protein JCM10207_001265 [Rhodosporidiobolus poonsookiae]